MAFTDDWAKLETEEANWREEHIRQLVSRGSAVRLPTHPRLSLGSTFEIVEILPPAAQRKALDEITYLTAKDIIAKRAGHRTFSGVLVNVIPVTSVLRLLKWKNKALIYTWLESTLTAGTQYLADGPFLRYFTVSEFLTTYPRLLSLGRAGVYVVRLAGLYKIGQTARLADRLTALTSGHPNMELVCFIPALYQADLEEHLHGIFRDARKGGEWFDLQDADLIYLKQQANIWADLTFPQTGTA